MSKEVGREVGRALKSLSERVSDLEGQDFSQPILAKLREVEVKADLVTHLDFQGLIDTFAAKEGDGAALVKSVQDLVEMFNSASDQASLDQMDAREAIKSAAHGLIEAVKSFEIELSTDGIEQKLATVAEAIAAFSVEAPQLVEALEANTQAINRQTEVITDVGARIIVQMRAARVLEFDNQGNPIGLRIVN